MDRQTAQILITKLDLNLITVKDAKAHVKRYNLLDMGRSKTQLIKALIKAIKD